MNKSQKTYYQELEHHAQTIATNAMDILVSMQGSQKTVVQKDVVDLSTTADIQAEQYIIDRIQKKYPDHNISSEEIGEIQKKGAYTWIIDPLDQTKEYVRGASDFNCLIGIKQKDIFIVGVSVLHGSNICYRGSKGNGAYVNDKRIQVSSQSNLLQSFIGFNLPNRMIPSEEQAKDIRLLESLISSVYRVRPCSDQAKTLGKVAQGILDGNIASPHLFKWYDIASSIAIVEEAGGVITDWFGNPVTEKTYTNGIVASNGVLHDTLLAMVQTRMKGTL